MKRAMTMLAMPLVFLLAACNDKPIDVIGKNKTVHNAHEVAVTFADGRCVFGALVAGGTAGMMDVPFPLKEPVSFLWTDAKGVKHEQKVSLPPVDRSKPGELVFTLTESGVTVVFQDRFK